MIFWLMEVWTSYGKAPYVFLFSSTRIILAIITALIFSLCLGPFLIRHLRQWKIRQTIRESECPELGELHKSKKGTPTMGGVLIFFSVMFSMILWMDWRVVFTPILFISLLFFSLIGFFDDLLKLLKKNTKGLPGKGKLFFQFLFVACLTSYLLLPAIQENAASFGFRTPVIKEFGKETSVEISVSEYAKRIYVPFYKEPLFILTGPIFGGMLLSFFFFFVIAGASNAVNLTDGLDGLAVGCTIPVCGCLIIFAFLSNHTEIARYLNILYVEGSGEIAVFLSALVGASLGFLWYNAAPANVFMGDTGSLAIGGVLGTAAVLLKRELLLAIIGGIFVVEALSVIVQVLSFKLFNKKRVFLCAPLHHHFEYKGWKETKVVIRFWIIALLLAFLGIISLKVQ